MATPKVSDLRIYPIKSLDPVLLLKATIGRYSLATDRSYAIVDTEGTYVNGKRTPKVHLLKTSYDLANNKVTFSDRNDANTHTFKLEEGIVALDDYLSSFFGMEVHLKHTSEGAFMDSGKKGCVTIASEASLYALQKDLESNSIEDLRLRFRSNVELSGVAPYWEEQLYTKPENGILFRIGSVKMIGIRPCPRCNVPPRDPLTGALDTTFAKRMMLSRKNQLDLAPHLRDHAKHTYYWSVNAYIPESEFGKTIQIHDSVEILEEISLENFSFMQS